MSFRTAKGMVSPMDAGCPIAARNRWEGRMRPFWQELQDGQKGRQFLSAGFKI